MGEANTLKKTPEPKDPQRRLILKDLELNPVDKEFTKNNESVIEFLYAGSNNNVQIFGEIYQDRKPKFIYLLKKKIVDETYNINLEPGLFSDTATEVKHNLQKLRKMYKSMGFKRIGSSSEFKMNIMDFVEWCKSKYSDEFFELL